MGYYYHDPSGLGVWYVDDGQTPAQAYQQVFANNNVITSPILDYSVANTPAAQQVNGGNPSPATKASPPPPTGYANQGASLIPTRSQASIITIGSGCFDPGLVAGVTSETPVYNDCGDGFFFDSFNNVCCPVSPVLGGGGFGGGSGVGASGNAVVDITVNNAVNLASGVGQAISDAVSTGIADAVDQAKAAAADAAGAVESGIQQTIDAVSTTATNLISDLKSALSWIGNLIQTNIGSLVSFITQNIGKVISAVSDAVTAVSNVVTSIIAPAIQSINNVINNTIAPIFNTISQVYQQTSALITAIEKDVNNGITGILQLPNDISNALTGIIGDIDRALGAIGLKTQAGTSVFIGPDGSDTIWSRLQGIGSNLGKPQGATDLHTTFGDKVNLSNPSLTQIGNLALATLHKLGLEAMAMEGQYHDDFMAAFRKSFTDVGGILGSVAELGVWWFLVSATTAGTLLPIYEAVKNDSFSNVPVAKLSPDEAIAASVRSFISEDAAREEMQFAGLDKTRQQVKLDLAKWLAPIDVAIDWYFREIIDYKDVSNNMYSHGITDVDQNALVEGSYRLVSVSLARTALRWGIIANDSFDAVLKQNRYTDNEIAMEHATLYQHEGVEDVIARERRQILYAGLGYTPEGYATPTQDTLTAAARDGIDAATALDRWQNSFFVLPLEQWVVAYFRNLVTLAQFNSAMDFYRVPSQQRDLLVGTHRSLIPWRTIPTMVANGIINEAYASQQLQAHGFDLVATEALLKYAGLTKPKPKVVAGSDIQGLSITTAKGYFDAGTIGGQEYEAVLLAHGYDEQTAALAVKVETQHAAMLERKQLATDIVAEVKAGAITVDQATAQMEGYQFSISEKASVLNRISSSRRQSVKRPSEAELHSMAKAGAISVDKYAETMIQDGWSQSWVDNFVKWRFPNAAPATGPA